MGNYYFLIEKAVVKIRATDLEEAKEEFEEYVAEFEQADYNTNPIEVEEC